MHLRLLIYAQSLIDRLALKLLLRTYPPKLSRCAVMSHVTAVASPDREFDKLSQAIQMKLDSFEEMLRIFTLPTVPKAKHSEASGRLRSMRSKPEPDRSSNIVLFGVRENKDQTVWRSEIAKVLSILSGRTNKLQMPFVLVVDSVLTKHDLYL